MKTVQKQSLLLFYFRFAQTECINMFTIGKSPSKKRPSTISISGTIRYIKWMQKDCRFATKSQDANCDRRKRSISCIKVLRIGRHFLSVYFTKIHQLF